MSGTITRRIQRSPLIAFLVIAFAITWFCWILAFVLAERNGLTLTNERNLLHLFVCSHCSWHRDKRLPMRPSAGARDRWWLPCWSRGR